MIPTPPPPLGADWKNWGERMNSFLMRTRDKLRYKDSTQSASEDGILMWDAVNECPVVSKNGQWIKIKLDP